MDLDLSLNQLNHFIQNIEILNVLKIIKNLSDSYAKFVKKLFIIAIFLFKSKSILFIEFKILGANNKNNSFFNNLGLIFFIFEALIIDYTLVNFNKKIVCYFIFAITYIIFQENIYVNIFQSKNHNYTMICLKLHLK